MEGRKRRRKERKEGRKRRRKWGKKATQKPKSVKKWRETHHKIVGLFQNEMLEIDYHIAALRYVGKKTFI